MWQTLLRIPHELAGVPVFGWGWALGVWALALVALGIAAAVRADARRWLVGSLPMLLLIGVAMLYVFPFLEERNPDPRLPPLGLAIRGYGVMMLLGVVSGVGLTLQRGERMGYDHDTIMSLTFWMFAAGIVGARLFHVIQYFDDFRSDDWRQTVAQMLRFSEGGLVVYGAVIGGVAAAALFCWRRGLSFLRTGDLAAPGMALGLALGRIGCLLNGCCHGGACEARWDSLTFPQGTHPYVQQLAEGRLLGMRLERDEEGTLHVAEVAPHGPAAERGVAVGDVIVLPRLAELQPTAPADRPVVFVETNGRPKGHWTRAELPSRSLPTKPAQVFSAINAALLSLLLLAWHPYRRRDGELFALMLTIYPITRFLLELIRTDEPGRFGTMLSISQWVSILVLVAIGSLWVVILRQPRRPLSPQL